MEPRIRKELGLDEPKRPPNRVKQAFVTVLLGFVYLSPLILFGAIGMSVAGMSLHQWHHPFWLSILYGFGSAFLCLTVLGGSGASTLFELGMRCTVILTLLLILMPIFARVRASAKHAKAVAPVAEHTR